MPGVPTGRGCQACRKQKKKCDQAQPSCARCSRLKIPCNGAGQRRFKFIDKQFPASEHVTASPGRENSRKSSSLGDSSCDAGSSGTVRSRSSASPLSQSQADAMSIIWAPSNAVSMMTGSFCSVLQVTDVRYDLSVYGDILSQIPRRLGRSEALDAAANAVATAFDTLQSRRTSLEVHASYGRALTSLRAALGDPSQAGSLDTLCAAYLVIICQGWVERGHTAAVSHAEALIHLMSLRSSQNERDEFESELLVNLSIMVVLECFAHTKVSFGPSFLALSEVHDRQTPVESLRVCSMVKLPEFVENPEQNLDGIHQYYKVLMRDTIEFRDTLAACTPPCVSATFHSRIQAAYGLMLAYALITNTLYRTWGPFDQEMENGVTFLVQEVVMLAKDATQYRPLGSNSMPLCIICAWASTPDVQQQRSLEVVLAEYQSDSYLTNWVKVAAWLKGRIGTFPRPPPEDVAQLWDRVKHDSQFLLSEGLCFSSDGQIILSPS